MSRKSKLDTKALQAIIARQIEQAESATDIANERADLFDAYMAEPYGDEVEGRSQVVSTDVSDTIEWIMPDLMEIFTSGDKVVSFEPLGPDDEQRADQETDVVNHVFMRLNPGFLTLYSMIKDGLVQKVGYAKHWWDEHESIEVEEYEGLTPDELILLHHMWVEDGAEVTIEKQEVTETGQGPSINISARVVSRSEGVKVAPCPPEEVLIAARWNSIFLDGCPFVAHKPTATTVSALIEQGYEREQVERMAGADENDEERVSRFSQRGASEDEHEAADLSMREVMMHECYIRVDYDGDGIAELRKVVVAGSGHEILRWEETGEDANEEVTSCPIVALTPIIVPHKHFGRSVAELVTDLQRIKTVLQRNMLDNIYLNNNPTKEIAEDGIGEHTIKDLLVQRPGKIVRTAMAGQYIEHSPANLLANILPAIEYVDTVRESRTGTSRLSQGLDANTINSTARGQGQLLSQAQKKIALIARILAETGVKALMIGIHDTLRRNASRGLTVQLTGGWVDVNPRHWKQRTDVAANVALGIGNAEQQIAKLMMIAERQEQNLLNGSPLATPKNLLHTYERIVSASGFKNPQAFWTDPDTVPPKEPQPDPEMIKVQGQLALQEKKAEGEAQLRAQDAAFDRQGRQDELALQREKIQAEMALAREKMMMDAQLARWKAEQEVAIKREVATIQAAVVHRNNEMRDATARETARTGE